MKKITLGMVFMGALVGVSSSLFAQWSAVRYDSLNVFTEVQALTSENVYVTGIDPTNYQPFLMHSTNSGQSWDSIEIVMSTNDYLSVHSMQFIEEETGFIGGTKNLGGFLYKTSNGGSNWSNITPIELNQAIRDISFLDSQTGYVAEPYAIHRTTNGGSDWNRFQIQPNFNIWDIHFLDAHTGFACGDTNLERALVAKTIDGGQTWQFLFDHYNNTFAKSFDKIDVIDQSQYVVGLRNSNYLFLTIDEGLNWDTIEVSVVNEIRDFDFISETKGYVLSWDGGIYTTNNGGESWSLQYTAEWGLYGPSVELNKLTFTDDNIGYVTGSSGLIKRYEDLMTHTQDMYSSEELIFPNPIRNGENIHLNLTPKTYTSLVRLMDIKGSILFERNVSDETYSNITLNTSNLGLRDGVYFIQIVSGNQVSSDKIIIIE